MQVLPDCIGCLSNLGEGCAQGKGQWPSAYSCSGKIYSTKREEYSKVASGEFKVYSETKPDKLLKYALFPN
jgi:hypothetical protein